MARASTPVPDLVETFERLDLATLRPHPRHDGTHPPEEIDHLKASITHHGIYRNVVVAQDGTILAGHGVVEAARALQLLVGDNHIARLRQQDDVGLAALLQDLATDDPLALLGTGYDAMAFQGLLHAHAVPPFEPVGFDEQQRLDRKVPIVCPHCGGEFFR